MSPKFTQCGQEFLAHAHHNYSHYLYHGKVQGILAQDGVRPDLITLKGCEDLCGKGSEYYSWKEASSTITTWVLPVVGLLIQAPFETNKFFKTCSALSRWVGSPIATLSYTLWNVKVIGKCALMVDMATDGYHGGEQQGRNSKFGMVRDSLYILSVMNQYSVYEEWLQHDSNDHAEKLLRIALFSDALPLPASGEHVPTLAEIRASLAQTLRTFRKKGVVPVFITMFWFLFALGISIQAAFGQIGENATAHDLAIGLLLSWLPVLILVSIVDRNPTATHAVKERLNELVNTVRGALLDPFLRTNYLQAINRTELDFEWANDIRHIPTTDRKREFFSDYAGQGRVRWHYGVAHPILAHVEDSLVAEKGRGWLEEPSSKADLDGKICASTDLGLRTFDFREIWQILSALVIVGGTITGAFILSYFTPTVGLGCRSGGYMIFFVLALANFSLEMLLWPYADWGFRSWLRRVRNHSGSRNRSDAGIQRGSTWDSEKWSGGIKHRRLQLLWYWKGLSDRDRFGLLILTPMDVGNAIWLTYIVMAQTFGSYRKCYCKGSGWGWHEGYLDFATDEYYRNHGVYNYWVPGTVLTCFVMITAITFITIEWCTQSHLNTEDYDDAMAGLRLTRSFKGRTIWIRNIADSIIDASLGVWDYIFKRTGKTRRRSLVWKPCKKRNLKNQPTLVVESGMAQPQRRADSQASASDQPLLLERPSATYSRPRSTERRESWRSSGAFGSEEEISFQNLGYELADRRPSIGSTDANVEHL